MVWPEPTRMRTTGFTRVTITATVDSCLFLVGFMSMVSTCMHWGSALKQFSEFVLVALLLVAKKLYHADKS